MLGQLIWSINGQKFLAPRRYPSQLDTNLRQEKSR